MRTVRAHFVDGPLSGNTTMLQRDEMVIQVPYLPEPPKIGYYDEDLPMMVEWRTLQYRATGMETRFGTRVYAYEP